MNDRSGSQFAFPVAAFRTKIRQRKQPVQGRSQHTVLAVLDAALQVLARDGYAKLTTTRVAERAGVSVGTLYQYFPDKASIITALRLRYLSGLVSHVRRDAEKLVGRPLRRALQGLLQSLFAFKREHLAAGAALREPMAEISQHEMIQAAGVELVGLTARLLQASVPKLLQPHKVATIVNAAIEGVIASALMQSANPFGPELERDLVDLIEAFVRTKLKRQR
jgi:AcrR family transcriptional regulator